MATKKQKQLEEQQRLQNRREICGVCLIAVGLFLAVSLYSDAVGVLGSAISRAFFALFGVLGYAVPVLFFLCGLLVIIFSARASKKSLYILTTAGILCMMAVLHAYVKPETAQIKFLAYIKEAFQLGLTERKGGGVFGALLAYPSLLLLGEVGLYIAYFSILIVIVLLLTRISIRSAGQKVGKTIKSGVETAVTTAKEHRANRPAKPSVLEDDDMFSEDLMQDLLENAPSPRRTVHKGTNAARRKPRQSEFDLDLRVEPSIPEADIGIRDLSKVKYNDEDIDFLPVSGELAKRKKSQIEQDIDDMIAAFDVPDATAIIPPKERKTRISENAPDVSALDDLVLGEKPVAPKVKPAPAPKSVAAADVPPMLPMRIEDAPQTYQFPPVTLLNKPTVKHGSGKDSPEMMGKLLIETLESFNISARILNISVGPVITRFELQPAQGIRVSRITTLSNDIALALAAPRVRIEAPIPGKAAVGIEIPNRDVSGVFLRDVLEAPEFKNAKSQITIGLGKDIAGNIITTDLGRMPHLLIAGSTGSGKSVCINGIITSLIYKSTPEDVRMILIDPKVVELKVFASLPHLYLPVVTEPKKAASALKWAVMEMEQRYRKMSECNARDLARYNALQSDPAEKMPLLVIVIDELADLMMVAAKDVEESICRIAQLGRACGIHLIVATQRPSSDIITGLIKANIPSRIAFMVSSAVDSRVIMDCNGAEKLLGKGDMLFHANGASKPIRVQGAFVSDEEVERIMDFFQKRDAAPTFKEDNYLEAVSATTAGPVQGNGKQEDELLDEAVKIVLESGQASISMIQRRLRVGYARAARLIDIMEQHKIVSGFDGSKPRKLLITSYEEYLHMNKGGEQSE
ncbi:MAG: DNA translocase FtsK [Eubacteriales bacterium]|nr:DNA translocase FtsK [Eubacteriales bacterium]